LSENLKDETLSEDLGVDGKIIKWILKKRVLGYGLDASVSRQGPVAGSCEHDNEPSASIKGRKRNFLTS
jgi:hypothetical protein